MTDDESTFGYFRFVHHTYLLSIFIHLTSHSNGQERGETTSSISEPPSDDQSPRPSSTSPGTSTTLRNSPSGPGGPPIGVKRHYNLANLPASSFWFLCFSIWTCTFLSALDGTIIATLLTPIGSSFNASTQTSWLGTSYLLSVCVFTPIYGRLSDISRRIAHLIAITFFTIGTIGCAAAPSMNMLIVARGLAGVGGGGINTVGVIIMTDLVDLRRRGMFQGYANIFFGLGAALGGPVGGLISDTIGWRGAFWVQPPLLILAGVGVWMNCSKIKSNNDSSGGRGNEGDNHWIEKIRQIDWAGLILLIVGVGSLLLAMSFKTSSTTSAGIEYKWSNPLIYGLLITSAITTILFILVEKYISTRPILPLSLLTRRTPLGVAISNFFMTLSQFSLLYNVPLYFQTVHLKSSSIAGAHLLPNSIMICFGSLFVGYIMRRTGRYWYLTLSCAGLIVCTCGFLCFWDEGFDGWGKWVQVAPGGFGYAGVLTTSLVALMSDVTREGKGEHAVATSSKSPLPTKLTPVSYLFRYIGQVLGVAFSSAIVQSILLSDLTEKITGEGSKAEIYFFHPRFTWTSAETAISAYAHALHVVFIVNLIWALLAILGVFVMKDEKMPEVEPKKPVEGSESEEA